MSTQQSGAMRRRTARLIILVLAFAAILWVGDNYTPKLLSCSSGLYPPSYCQAIRMHVVVETFIVLLVAMAVWAATLDMSR